jgi:hypothetical protein
VVCRGPRREAQRDLEQKLEEASLQLAIQDGAHSVELCLAQEQVQRAVDQSMDLACKVRELDQKLEEARLQLGQRESVHTVELSQMEEQVQRGVDQAMDLACKVRDLDRKLEEARLQLSQRESAHSVELSQMEEQAQRAVDQSMDLACKVRELDQKLEDAALQLARQERTSALVVTRTEEQLRDANSQSLELAGTILILERKLEEVTTANALHKNLHIVSVSEMEDRLHKSLEQAMDFACRIRELEAELREASQQVQQHEYVKGNTASPLEQEWQKSHEDLDVEKASRESSWETGSKEGESLQRKRNRGTSVSTEAELAHAKEQAMDFACRIRDLENKLDTYAQSKAGSASHLSRQSEVPDVNPAISTSKSGTLLSVSPPRDGCSTNLHTTTSLSCVSACANVVPDATVISTGHPVSDSPVSDATTVASTSSCSAILKRSSVATSALEIALARATDQAMDFACRLQILEGKLASSPSRTVSLESGMASIHTHGQSKSALADSICTWVEHKTHGERKQSSKDCATEQASKADKEDSITAVWDVDEMALVQRADFIHGAPTDLCGEHAHLSRRTGRSLRPCCMLLTKTE